VADVIHDAGGRAVALRVSSRLDAGQKAHRQKGAYLLRTNCEETDPALLWKWYIQLTQAEAAFRTAKSDLGLRPVFHQKEDRVQAHILVCFLALALWRSLEQWMQAQGLGTCARQLVKEVATIKSVDVILPVLRDKVRTHLRLRVVPPPTGHRPIARPPRAAPAQRSSHRGRCSAENRPLNNAKCCGAIAALSELTNSG
jgi:hypothetical protein